eukprot:764798-Hanusia_phi.AAC.2
MFPPSLLPFPSPPLLSSPLLSSPLLSFALLKMHQQFSSSPAGDLSALSWASTDLVVMAKVLPNVGGDQERGISKR